MKQKHLQELSAVFFFFFFISPSSRAQTHTHTYTLNPQCAPGVSACNPSLHKHLQPGVLSVYVSPIKQPVQA